MRQFWRIHKLGPAQNQVYHLTLNIDLGVLHVFSLLNNMTIEIRFVTLTFVISFQESFNSLTEPLLAMSPSAPPLHPWEIGPQPIYREQFDGENNAQLQEQQPHFGIPSTVA